MFPDRGKLYHPSRPKILDQPVRPEIGRLYHPVKPKRERLYPPVRPERWRLYHPVKPKRGKLYHPVRGWLLTSVLQSVVYWLYSIMHTHPLHKHKHINR